MKIRYAIRRILCILLSVSIFCVFSACSNANGVYTASEAAFQELENGNLISLSGEEYALVAYEGVLSPCGELTYIGGVEGDAKVCRHLGGSTPTGVFSIQGDESLNVLVRQSTGEWKSIYRKTSLPPLDYSADNCIRLELVINGDVFSIDAAHKTCGDGICDKTEIAAFLSDVRSQQDPREAGLIDMITTPSGSLNNCYTYGVVYGFVAEEPYLATSMDITSFNDLGYSIYMDDAFYVLPEEWLQRLQAKN